MFCSFFLTIIMNAVSSQATRQINKVKEDLSKLDDENSIVSNALTGVFYIIPALHC